MSSSSKENLKKGIFLSKQRRSLKNLYQSGNFFTTMESFGDRKLMRKHSELSSMQISKTNFHKTVANCEWIRPQSKQASRNFPTRPQTSKGSRKQPTGQSVNLLQSMIIKKQQQPSTLHKASTTAITKKLFKQRQANGANGKQGLHENETESCNVQNRELMAFNDWQKYDPRRAIKQNRQEEDVDENEVCQDIEIVVNRREAKNSSRQKLPQPQSLPTPIKKGPSMYKNKFQTDLDDEFLELFAD